MKAKYSVMWTRNRLVVDCSECQRGGNGDGACPTGGHIKYGIRACCRDGKLLKGLEMTGWR